LNKATRSRRTPVVRQPESGPRSVATWVTAVIGLVLVALSTLPVYRLLDSPDTGLAGASTAECVWHARSDARGILGVTPFLGRGDLPWTGGKGALFVQDLGPERNAALLALHPERQPYVYMMPDPEATLPVLLPYDQAMAQLWDRSAAAGRPDSGRPQ
jgi:hypothetical protein